MRLCFATHNQHKLNEIQALVPEGIELVGLHDLQCLEEIPETGKTLKDNALQKAQFVWDHYHINCFADDTGLEVIALKGAPGVYSARYARPQKDNHANCHKLLQELAGIRDRRAQFRTVICLMLEGTPTFFEGIIQGEIVAEPLGEQGFGYDPLFRPQGYELTFAQMSPQQKNSCSHRARAIEQLVDFLKDR